MRIVVLGSGGHGKVVADVVRACGHVVLGFVDRSPERKGLEVTSGVRVVATEAELLVSPACICDGVAIGVGDNSARFRLYQLLKGKIDLPVFLHPTAFISEGAEILGGTIALPRVVVGERTRIGEAVILNTRSEIGAMVELGHAVHVSPGARLSPGCIVEDEAWIGASGQVLRDVRIGSGAVVGAGAVAVTNVAVGEVVVGQPARALLDRMRKVNE